MAIAIARLRLCHFGCIIKYNQATRVQAGAPPVGSEGVELNESSVASVEKDANVTNMPAQIADEVRTMITRGSLAPGVHLGQAELAVTFQSSRVPVREALKLLAAEGVVTHDQNRGFFVASLSSVEARQLYRVRQLIEAEILRTVKWPSASELKLLWAQVELSEGLRRDGRMMEWLAVHRRLREAVFDLSSEKFIVREALRLWSAADRYRSLLAATPHPSIRPDGSSTDRHLVEALAEHDREKLLGVFEVDRGRIAQTLVEILTARGL
jgi:DNA-binding GntR family transcriptional regulator